MDLVNADNIEPKDVDIAVMEEQLFNNPDPYDLAETEHIDPALQEHTTRSSTRFEVGNFIKLDDDKLDSRTRGSHQHKFRSPKFQTNWRAW